MKAKLVGGMPGVKDTTYVFWDCDGRRDMHVLCEVETYLGYIRYGCRCPCHAD